MEGEYKAKKANEMKTEFYKDSEYDYFDSTESC